MCLQLVTGTHLKQQNMRFSYQDSWFIIFIVIDINAFSEDISSRQIDRKFNRVTLKGRKEILFKEPFWKHYKNRQEK